MRPSHVDDPVARLLVSLKRGFDLKCPNFSLLATARD